MAEKETWITGIGIVSCLGEGPDAHWQAFGAGQTGADAAKFPPSITPSRNNTAASAIVDTVKDRPSICTNSSLVSPIA